MNLCHVQPLRYLPDYSSVVKYPAYVYCYCLNSASNVVVAVVAVAEVEAEAVIEIVVVFGPDVDALAVVSDVVAVVVVPRISLRQMSDCKWNFVEIRSLTVSVVMWTLLKIGNYCC